MNEVDEILERTERVHAALSRTSRYDTRNLVELRLMGAIAAMRDVQNMVAQSVTLRAMADDLLGKIETVIRASSTPRMQIAISRAFCATAQFRAMLLEELTTV